MKRTYIILELLVVVSISVITVTTALVVGEVSTVVVGRRNTPIELDGVSSNPGGVVLVISLEHTRFGEDTRTKGRGSGDVTLGVELHGGSTGSEEERCDELHNCNGFGMNGVGVNVWL